MNGPKVYAKLSSVAEQFLNREHNIQKPKFIPKYEYLSSGANLPIQKAEEDSIHKFLGASAITKNIEEEFGNALDIVG
jgi:hypothetical protein